MKYFNSYITEVFDQAYPWRHNKDSGTQENYTFDTVRLTGSTEWIPDPGYIPSGRPISVSYATQLQQAHFKKYPGERQRIVVQFSRNHGSTAYESWKKLTRSKQTANLLISLPEWERCWEIGFATYVNKEGEGYDQGTDDDLGGTNTKHAVKIFGTIIQCVKHFISGVHPLGVYWGTKTGARPVRAQIYNGIAKRLSSEFQAKVVGIPAPRPEMANTQLALFGFSVVKS